MTRALTLDTLPPRCVKVLLALCALGGRPATYNGMRHALGYNTYKGAVAAVRQAKSYGVVYVSTAAYKRTVLINLSPSGKEALRHAGLID